MFYFVLYCSFQFRLKNNTSGEFLNNYVRNFHRLADGDFSLGRKI